MNLKFDEPGSYKAICAAVCDQHCPITHLHPSLILIGAMVSIIFLAGFANRRWVFGLTKDATMARWS